MKIHNVEVKGANVDSQTRCAHYHKDVDIIAVKFRCCGEWFPCYECHAEFSDHPAQVWSLEEHAAKAVLCGNCGYHLAIDEYMNCDSVCPKCRSGFNPGCVRHYDLYFQTSD